MLRLSLVIFDLDGVLVDSSAAHAAAYDDLYRALVIDGPPYPEIAGRPTRSVVQELTRDRQPDPAAIDGWVALKQEAARRYLDGPALVFPDSSAALRALRGVGLRVAIGTSASRTTTFAVLRAAGWQPDLDFTVVVTADDVRAGKPDPEIYQQVMAVAAVPPERTLIVEDSTAGLAAAVSSGAWVVSVRTGEIAASRRFLGAFPSLDGVVELVTEGRAWATSS